MAINSIYHIYDETDWRPDYYLCFDIAHQIIRNDRGVRAELIPAVKANLQNDTCCILPQEVEHAFDEKQNICYCNSYDLIGLNDKRHPNHTGNLLSVWSPDAQKRLYGWGTTLLAASQIAYFLGFREIFFLGCDLWQELDYQLFKSGRKGRTHSGGPENKLTKLAHFASSSSAPLRSALNLIWHYFRTKTSQTDPNHFSNKYSPGSTYDAERLNSKMIMAHECIKKAADMYGFRVANATQGGMLEVYERVDIYDVLTRRN
jgi:hypothetical protein